MWYRYDIKYQSRNLRVVRSVFVNRVGTVTCPRNTSQVCLRRIYKLPSGGRILLSSGTHARALCSLRGRDIEAVRPHLRCDSALTPPGTLPPVASASLPAPWQRAPAGRQVRSYTSPVLMSSWPHGAQARATPTEAPFWGPIDALVDWCEPNYAVTRYVAEFWNTLSR